MCHVPQLLHEGQCSFHRQTPRLTGSSSRGRKSREYSAGVGGFQMVLSENSYYCIEYGKTRGFEMKSTVTVQVSGFSW